MIGSRAIPVMVGALVLACGGDSPESWQTEYLTTAHQEGVVGYRDPLGTISPNGEWFAYSVGSDVVLQRTGLGAPRTLRGNERPARRLLFDPAGPWVVTAEADTAVRWWNHGVTVDSLAPRWPAGTVFKATDQRRVERSARPAEFADLAISRDGQTVVGLVPRADGTEIWSMSPTRLRVTWNPSGLSFPATIDFRWIACLREIDGVPRLTEPCGETPKGDAITLPAYGPVTFSGDGKRVYFGSPNERGFLDTWALDLASRKAHRIIGLGRDTYAPVALADGRLLVKHQTYRTLIARIPAAGGQVEQVTTFQSETPSWDPTSRFIGITYGSWRRAVDDYHYPDIAQDVGLVALDSLPRGSPSRVIHASESEDQGMHWSPNGKWIVLHSHKQQSDDLWLLKADGSDTARRITELGRGSETGWPRWSPDGRFVAFGANSRLRPGRGSVYVIGVDQESGTVTAPLRELPGPADDDALHGEWMPDSKWLVIDLSFGPRHRLSMIDLAGGAPRPFYEYETPQRFPGFGLSPDGRHVAFAAQSLDRRMQLFQAPTTPGEPAKPLTFDWSDKTQPSYSPDGKWLAFTIWQYDVSFWLLNRDSTTGPER